MKTILATLSVINVLMGLMLLGLMFVAEDTPLMVVLALAIGMLAQGGYTLAYLAGVLGGFEPWSRRVLLGGQTVALVVGLSGFASSALYNLNPPGGDYEYGPLTVGALIALQGAATLWIYAVGQQHRGAQTEPAG
jgi:hypothetical protein